MMFHLRLRTRYENSISYVKNCSTLRLISMEKFTQFERLTYTSVWTVTQLHDWMSKSNGLHNAWVREPSRRRLARVIPVLQRLLILCYTSYLRAAFTMQNPISHYFGFGFRYFTEEYPIPRIEKTVDSPGHSPELAGFSLHRRTDSDSPDFERTKIGNGLRYLCYNRQNRYCTTVYRLGDKIESTEISLPSKNIARLPYSIPIKIIESSIGDFDESLRAKEMEKKFLKRGVRIRKTHDAKPTASFAYKTPRTFAHLLLRFFFFLFLFSFFFPYFFFPSASFLQLSLQPANRQFPSLCFSWQNSRKFSGRTGIHML